MKKSNTNISDELLIGYIEGKLSDEQKEKVESLLEDDNLVFLQYARLNKAYKDMHSRVFEVTPDHLKERLMTELSISRATNAQPSNLITNLNSFLNKIAFKQPGLAAISMVFIAFISIIIIRQTPPSDTMNFPLGNNLKDKTKIAEIIKSLNDNSNSFESVNAKKQNGLFVSLDNNILSINQPLMVKRDIYVFGYDKNILLNEKINDKENSIILNDLIKNDSLRVMIETEGVIVYDKWIQIDQP